MDFRLLGPVEVHGGRGPVALGGRRARSIVAALLLDANRLVPVAALAAAAWGDDPPATANAQVRNRVSALRRLLSSHADGATALITTQGPGYVFHVAEDELDVGRFDRLIAEVDLMLGRGERDRAAANLREALGLWRGPALEALRTPPLEAAARRLEEARAQALERWVEIELSAGRDREMLVELTELVAAHPYRETLWGCLMLAQYRSGRQADALQTFRRVRARFSEQLGIEPGVPLQRLHEAILRRDDRSAEAAAIRPLAAPRATATTDAPSRDPAAAVTPQIPRQLPRDATAFSGRGNEIRALDALLEPAGGVAAIVGTAGVGKTALAVHWAHRVADRFPDGQLYVDLRGYALGPPARISDALAQLLRALDPAAGALPPTVAEAAAQYRSRLAGKRVLVVLDNARSVEQIRPLLPGSPLCMVVVTSRERLGGLVAREGAHRIELDVLSPAEAGALLDRVLGPERLAAEPAEVGELCRMCAYLPLALRIAAANVTDGVRRSITDYVAELAAGAKVGVLTVEGDREAAVQTAFDVSYGTVPPAARRLFRLLGLVPGPDFTAGAAAALAQVAPDEAARLLTRLAAAHLIQQHLPGRFTFHDLLRRYALEHAERTPVESRAAATRLFQWYLHGTDQAVRLVYPETLGVPMPEKNSDVDAVAFGDRGGAVAWLHAERANLVAACVAMAGSGRRPLAWLLASALRGHLVRHGHRAERFAVARAGLDAATAEGDEHAMALLHQDVAHVHHGEGRHDEAIACLERALALSRRTGWRDCEATAHSNLGIVYGETGQLERAVEHFTWALEVNRQTGWTIGVAVAMANLGTLYRTQGELEAAARHLEEAIVTFQRAAVPRRAVEAHASLGATLRQLGRIAEALHHLDLCRTLCQESGNRFCETGVLVSLAAVYGDAGDHEVALGHAEDARQTARAMGFTLKEMDALNTVGVIHSLRGDHGAALESHRMALRLTRSTHGAYQGVKARVGMANAYAAIGRHDDALRYGLDALHLAQQCRFAVLRGLALTATARAHLGIGAPLQALDYARRALEGHRKTGHRRGEAEAVALLRHIVRVT